MSNSKRLFEILDEMNQDDDKNKNALVGVCPDFVSATTGKHGDKITMGTPAGSLLSIESAKVIPILLLIDQKEYFKRKDEPRKDDERVITDLDKQLSLLRGENQKLKEEALFNAITVLPEKDAEIERAHQQIKTLAEALEKIKLETEATIETPSGTASAWNDDISIIHEFACEALSTLQGETKDGWIREEHYEIMFGGTLKCKVGLRNGVIEVLAAMNGAGDTIPVNEISVVLTNNK